MFEITDCSLSTSTTCISAIKFTMKSALTKHSWSVQHNLVLLRPTLSKPSVAARRAHPDDNDVRLRDPKDGYSSLFPLGADFLEELSQSPGVRVVIEQPGTNPLGDDDDDEEDWDEVMSQLTDPWMAEPPPASDGFEGLTPPTPVATAVPLPIADVEVVSDHSELLSVLMLQPDLIIVDVRTFQEIDEQGGLQGATHCPMDTLTGDVAKQLAQRPILVLGTGDYRGSQACVRLTRVYGGLTVYYYESGLQDEDARRTLQQHIRKQKQS